MSRRLLNRWRGRLGPVLQSDREFIETAFERILGRPVDTAGLTHYLAAFKDGLGRIDLLLELAASDELMNKLARAARAKAGPRALRPELYREMVDRGNGNVIPVFEARGAADFDWLETSILDGGYYEKPGVWSLGLDLDKHVMAEMLASFAPARALELGCAAGGVVECLAEDHGVAAEGIDISWMALARASPRIRERLHHGDLLTLELPVAYDLVFGLDVFEHLNPNRIDAYAARIGEVVEGEGYLFCNIPAFGRDEVFGTVFPYYLDGWEVDTAAGRPFGTLHVDPRGYPIHGHLTWADARWWVQRFAGAGFTREPDIERALHAKYDEYMVRSTPARRAYFVFARNPSAARRAQIIDRIGSQPSRWIGS